MLEPNLLHQTLSIMLFGIPLCSCDGVVGRLGAGALEGLGRLQETRPGWVGRALAANQGCHSLGGRCSAEVDGRNYPEH